MPIATENMTINMASKRTVQVNVKMSEEDFALLKKAAAAHWPDAVLTNSGIVLGLAKIGGKAVLSRGKKH
jgi:hypothetical protein